MNEKNAGTCERAGDLLTVLYQESSEAEARSFNQHMLSCSDCRKEFAEFRNIRKPLMAWRQESLSSLAKRDAPIARTPSAMAALREFFSLSPLWMKAAVAFGSVLFCVFAVLTLVSFQKESQPYSQSLPNNSLTSDQIEELVNKRAQERLAQMKAHDEEKTLSVMNKPEQRVKQKARSSLRQIAHQQRQLPLTRAERAQLAADLRLSNADEETELDLLSDR